MTEMPLIPIDALDTTLCARAEVHADVVVDYADRMRAGDRFDPVIVVQYRRRGPLWLVDGRHRVEANRLLGHEKISAQVHRGDRQQALKEACRANTTHGLRRTSDDKRRAVELMLEECWPEPLSNRQIADHCAVSHALVGDVRREIEGRLEESSSETRTDKNGRRMNVSKIKEANKRRARPRVPDEKIDVLRSSPGRTCQELADELGVHKSTVSRNRRGLSNYDPDYARRLEVDALTKAWDAASPEAQAEFVGWLQEKHPEWFGPASAAA